MMHYSNAVLVLKELPSKKVLREYNHSRNGETSEVFCNLAFGSEYALGYKFTDGLRRRLELSIDGALVTRDLILDGEGLLERFVDSDKRFKFVSADHAAVADPTSPDNGFIEVKLYTELPSPPIIHHIYHQDPWVWRGGPTYGSTTGDTKLTSSNAILRGSSMGGFSSTSIQCSASSTPLNMVSPCSATYGDAGATVEGSKSNQKFGTTTWRGDFGIPTVFRFRLRGVSKGVENTPKKAIECPFCHTFSKGSAKFCADCGAEFIKVG